MTLTECFCFCYHTISHEKGNIFGSQILFLILKQIKTFGKEKSLIILNKNVKINQGFRKSRIKRLIFKIKELVLSQ